MSDPSPRELAQARLVDYLNAHGRYWNAPYGVLTGMRDLPRGGKARSVTFGVARWLDASVLILSPTRIDVRGEGALAPDVEGQYTSVEQLIERLRRLDRSDHEESNG